MILNILQTPDPLLTQVATKVPSDLSDLQRVQDLVQTFAVTPSCVSLSMNQIGFLIRAIVVDVSLDRTETYVMLDPMITKASEDQQRVRDGCMSVGHGKRFAYTHRPKRITVEWLSTTGERRRQKFSGFIAAVIHHEIDHLNGVLFTSRTQGGLS